MEPMGLFKVSDSRECSSFNLTPVSSLYSNSSHSSLSSISSLYSNSSHSSLSSHYFHCKNSATRSEVRAALIC